MAAYPQPSKAELEDYYQKQYFRGDRYETDFNEKNSQVWKTWTRRLELIESVMSQKGVADKTLLDIGAGTGAFCAAAIDRGWRVSCVEFSDVGRKAIRERLPSIRKVDSIFEASLFPQSRFDLITMWAVIEHMPYDPNLLKSLFSLLRPGGIAAFSYPNPVTLNRYLFGRKWRYFIPTEHLAFYPPKLFKQLCEDAGFVIASEGSFFSGLATHDGLSRSCVRWLPRRFKNSIRRSVERLNSLLFFGDTYEVLAVKPASSCE